MNEQKSEAESYLRDSLQKKLDELLLIKPTRSDWAMVEAWHAGVRPIFVESLEDHLRKFDELKRPGFRFTYSESIFSPAPWRSEEQLRENEQRALNAFSKLVEFMKTIIDLKTNAPVATARNPESCSSWKDIFIVHGHDHEMKVAVARVLERLKLNPIILHEQPNGAKTIIEKFEKNASEVGFAVVLMSPDDHGYSKAEGPERAESRARQNVVMELGYFIGKLGRGKVMVLKRGDVKEPSDLNGVVYTPFDDHDGWQQKLVRELLAAGYAIDTSALFK